MSTQISERWSWRASDGRYYQQPFFLFLATFPENRSLVPFRANHCATGLAYAGAMSWRATVEVYRRDYREYPVAAGGGSMQQKPR